MNKNRPVHEVRLGFVKATIWENNLGETTRHAVTLSRIYKEKETDQWKTTESFGRDDLLLVAKAADRAHDWICDQRTNESRNTAGPQPVAAISKRP
jgi:hypothetical protein